VKVLESYAPLDRQDLARLVYGRELPIVDMREYGREYDRRKRALARTKEQS
jgi:hypothetical protein